MVKFNVPSSLKGLVFYCFFFVLGFFYFYSSEDVNPITREPSSINENDLIVATTKQVLSRSPIADEKIISQLLGEMTIQNEVDPGTSQVNAKTLKFKKIILKNENNERFHIFDINSTVILNFESLNEAASGRPSQLIISSSLDIKKCRNGYCEVRLPMNDIFSDDVRDNDMSIGDLKVSLQNIVASEWPKRWVLTSIKYSKNGASRDPSSSDQAAALYTFQFQTHRVGKMQPTIIER